VAGIGVSLGVGLGVSLGEGEGQVRLALQGALDGFEVGAPAAVDLDDSAVALVGAELMTAAPADATSNPAVTTPNAPRRGFMLREFHAGGPDSFPVSPEAPS
jgi:hypothetical protein